MRQRHGYRCVLVSGPTEAAVLYGTFRYLNAIRREDLLPIGQSAPKLSLRMWDLWDNVDGSVERGYAGKSVFHWEELPGKMRPRYRDYARLLASVGINAIVCECGCALPPHGPTLATKVMCPLAHAVCVAHGLAVQQGTM